MVPEANSDSDPAERVRLFVYGTLRTPVGGPPADTFYHSEIAAHIFDSEPGVLARATLYDCGAFPALGPGDSTVTGEILTIGAAGLVAADAIEDHPDYYERRTETIERSDGSFVDAWAYWAPKSLIERSDLIPSGDWFDRER